MKLPAKNFFRQMHVQEMVSIKKESALRDGKYKYQETKEQLRQMAAALEPGQPFPNRNALARECGVARVTVERAISELIGEGVLISRDGSGTFAAPPKTDSSSAEDGLWALLTYSVTKGLTPLILRGVEDFADSKGISLIVCNTDNEAEKESRYLKRLLRQHISGIIIIPSVHTMPDPTIFEKIRLRGIPVAACSRQIAGFDLPGAFQNFFHAGFMATQHLLDVGCRRIAYFGSARYFSVEDRLQGYLAALEQHNAVHPEDPVHHGRQLAKDESDIELRMDEFLTAHPHTDGIYLVNDRLAIPLYAVMRRKGLKPGRDIRVVSGEDSGFARDFWVPLSAINFPAYRMGMLSAEALWHLTEGMRPESLPREVLSGELQLRESSTGTETIE